MRYRGLMTVCVLTCGLIAVLAVSAGAQTTKPAEPELVPVPSDKTVPVAPAVAGAPTDTATAGDGNSASDANSTGDTHNNKPRQGPDMWLFGILLGGVVLMWLWMGRGRRKKEAQHREMLANLKKGDKVTTIGGIIGTVIEAKPDEITVKVDETNNIRMKFSRWAIRGVGEEGKTNPNNDKK